MLRIAGQMLSLILIVAGALALLRLTLGEWSLITQNGRDPWALFFVSLGGAMTFVAPSILLGGICRTISAAQSFMFFTTAWTIALLSVFALLTLT